MQFKMNNVATCAKGIEKANEMIVAGVRQEQAAKTDFTDSLSQTFSTRKYVRITMKRMRESLRPYLRSKHLYELTTHVS